MTKLKIMVACSYGGLEKKVNDWIEQENIDVVDIRVVFDTHNCVSYITYRVKQTSEVNN